ncbi:MAG: potassium transporter KefB [Waddliaceae bacterium]|nr:potassium transporter KefB [Waddliaceae bacterium]
MEFVLFKDVVIVFGLAMAVILVCKPIKIPNLVALLITGVLSGPNALGIIQDAHEVEPLAEVGIAFLLFSIGIELSLRRFLLGIRQIIFGGGGQVALTLLASGACALLLGRPPGEAIFLGCLISLSSTAIVVTLLQERGEVATPSGRFSVSVLIFQDIIIVPMILTVPLLAGSGIDVDTSFCYLIAQAVAILTSVLLAGHWMVPRLLHMIARTKDTRLFLLTVLFICFSVAWLTSSLGLSFGLGAFLSGLIISESEYSYHTLGNIFPFQEIFTCFFFVSAGMLLDASFVIQYPFLIAGCLIGIALLKASTTAAVAMMMGYPIGTACVAGLTLCQVGEFSFLLVKTGMSHDIGTPFYYQLFLSTTLFSMALAPLMVHLAPRFVRHLQNTGWISPDTPAKTIQEAEERSLTGHVVIVGFGTGGRNLAYSLKMAGIPYIILEIDPETVRKEQRKGEPILFGDASHSSVLSHVKIKTARLLAVLVNDERASGHIITNARRSNASLHIVVRTRYVASIKRLMNLGANEVIPEELEASIEVFTRVMLKCLIPRNEIDKVADDLRSSHYEKFREPLLAPIRFADLNLDFAQMEIDTLRIEEGSPLDGISLREAAFRRKHGVTILVIQRAGQQHWEIDPDMELSAKDVLAVFGRHEKIQKITQYFHKYK